MNSNAPNAMIARLKHSLQDLCVFRCSLFPSNFGGGKVLVIASQSGVAPANQTKEGQFMNFSQGHSGQKKFKVNRACFPKEKHQNSQKWAKFMNFSFWPYLWFVRKILVSVNFLSAILGPEMAAPIYGKTMSINFLVLGGGYFGFWGGGGKCRFYFLWARGFFWICHETMGRQLCCETSGCLAWPFGQATRQRDPLCAPHPELKKKTLRGGKKKKNYPEGLARHI